MKQWQKENPKEIYVERKQQPKMFERKVDSSKQYNILERPTPNWLEAKQWLHNLNILSWFCSSVYIWQTWALSIQEYSIQ